MAGLIERYRKWLPVTGDTPVVSLEEGSTPLIPAPRLAERIGGDRRVLLKFEGANPTGSYEDRWALAMIEGAERRGSLAPGQTVVEHTGGSTGSSLAFVWAIKGYPLKDRGGALRSPGTARGSCHAPARKRRSDCPRTTPLRVKGVFGGCGGLRASRPIGRSDR